MPNDAPKSGLRRYLSPTALTISGMLLIFLTGTEPLQAEDVCQDLFQPAAVHIKKRTRDLEMPDDLWNLYGSESRMLSKGGVKRENDRALRFFDETIPPFQEGLAQYATYDDLANIRNAVLKHPDFAPGTYAAYEHDGHIEYCFGRAAYVHWLLMKMGLSQGSVRKVWALGPMNSEDGKIKWDFHVAIAVYTHDRGWLVIDTSSPKPEPVRHWLSTYSELNAEGRVRLYVTDASRFTPVSPLYTRLELGLDMDPKDDWYRGFFKKMMQATRDEKLEDLGLRRLPPTTTETVVKPARRGLFGSLFGG